MMSFLEFLIVEDLPEEGQFLENTLHDFFLEREYTTAFKHVKDVSSGREVVLNFSGDCIILDYRLWNKRRLLEYFMENRDKICVPVLVVTAYYDQIAWAEPNGLVPFAVIEKPKAGLMEAKRPKQFQDREQFATRLCYLAKIAVYARSLIRDIEHLRSEVVTASSETNKDTRDGGTEVTINTRIGTVETGSTVILGSLLIELRDGVAKMRSAPGQRSAELTMELESASEGLDRLSPNASPGEIRDSGVLPKVKRLVKNALASGSRIGEELKNIEGGLGTVEKIAKACDRLTSIIDLH